VCWCASEALKYVKCNHNGGHDDFLHKCINVCKNHIANLALKASRFSQALLQGSPTRKWLLSLKVEAWYFTAKKLLKLINSTK